MEVETRDGGVEDVSVPYVFHCLHCCLLIFSLFALCRLSSSSPLSEPFFTNQYLLVPQDILPFEEQTRDIRAGLFSETDFRASGEQGY